ncbi:spermidine synthase [Nitzschia inconspicua]|uniref:Spermidine synthase n=1 Tax=Nitzschia inconspicua TaxID=303405 RepID=A0A9K3Q4W3_9STRA|nr:spermidine synthase [Nitzschia inconspicua]
MIRSSVPANGSSSQKKIRGIQNGWFTETATMWPGQRFSLALKNYDEENSILYHKRSEFQEILIFQSAQYGKVFAIDGILQLTERDVFTFHEMMAHVPLCSHRNPERVLIVGGGDGAILREVCRHPEVTHITLVEIDPMVIEASKECLKIVPPETWDDPRLEIVHQDAAEYVEDPTNHNRFDVILADTLDPLGPAESLFEPEFYEAMHAALRPNGIVCTQGESTWIHLDLVRDLVSCCADIFDTSEYATTSIPSYPCGQIGFILARKGDGSNSRTRGCSVPVRTPAFQKDLKWYNSQMHRAAFVLPQYVKKELNAPDVNLTGRIRNVNEEEEDENGEEDDQCFLRGCTIQ